VTGLATTLVFLPLAAAILTLVSGRSAVWIAVLSAAGVLAAAIGLFVLLPPGGMPLIPLGGWDVPLGIQWRVDGLSALMLLLTAVIAVVVSGYARGYFLDAGTANRYFWPLWMLMLAGLNALFLSNDLFNLYVTLEILGLSAVALVTLAGTGTADRAAFRYLLVSLLGSLLYLAGVALVYAGYGTLDMLALRDAVRDTPATWLAAALMFAGLLLKSAVFPLHFWLPPAHSSAPAPVSALLSALVVKGSLFILLRLWLDVAPAAPSGTLGMLLGLAGVAAIGWGSVCALLTHRLKLLVAYSTVAQLGYVMFFFPMSGSPAAGTALAGVMYFIVAHGCAKAAMFLAAGNLQRSAGHDTISSLGRAAASLPITMFAFGLAGASIMGLPPSGGFIAKWTLLNAALASGQWLWLVPMAVGGLLSAAYVFRVLALSFQSEAHPAPGGGDLRPVSPVMQWAPLVLALVAVLLGFNALPVLNAVGTGT